MELSKGLLLLVLIVCTHSGHAAGIPTAVLVLNPDQSQFYIGESVTLKCSIQQNSSRWWYSWQRDGQKVYPRVNLRTKSNKYTIQHLQVSHSGNYTCNRYDDREEFKSRTKAIHVSEKPRAVLSSLSQTWLTEGDSVTLSCEVRGSTTDWRFHWYKTSPYRPGHGLRYITHKNKIYDVEGVSDSIRGSGGSYTLSPAALRHTGVYVCRAERGEPVYHTEFSQPQPLWVTGVSPPASVIIHSNWTQIFTFESLSLSCVVQGNSTGWTLRWFTGRGGESKCRSETRSSCSIRSASPSDSGVYWCQFESGEQSNPVNITVHDGDVILESPAHPVTEGDALTLRCRFRFKISNIRADFYKDGTLLQTSTTGEMTIPAVSKSHDGLYKCRNPERGESPESWITIRMFTVMYTYMIFGYDTVNCSVFTVSDPDSSKLVVVVIVVIGLLIGFALVTLLALLFHFNKVKDSGSSTVRRNLDQQLQTTNQSSDPDQTTNQSSDPDQRNQDQSQSAGSEGTQSEYMPLQKRCTDDYGTLTPLYMPLQKAGSTDVYETIKSSKDSCEGFEEGYDDVDLPDT
ncbi:cell adhesion molecule-related/down-regulated by oncogenes-like [Sardina pilchardus]|uniref:cell adhesion molecule-related/down-regulated by oncogenes-like n=1 Tax=Sardina pilchardus TaxID=27697 RepID=UPI002E121309